MEKGSREKEGVAGEKGNGRRPAWAQPGDRRVSRSRTLPTRPLLPFPAISRPPPSRLQSPGSLPRLNTCQLRDANCEQLTASPPSSSSTSLVPARLRPLGVPFLHQAKHPCSTRALDPCSVCSDVPPQARCGIRPPTNLLSSIITWVQHPPSLTSAATGAPPFPGNSLAIRPLLRSWLALRTTRVVVHKRGLYMAALVLYAHSPVDKISAHSRDARRLRSASFRLLSILCL